MLFRLKLGEELCRVMECRLSVTAKSTLKYQRKFVPRELSVRGLVMFLAYDPVEVHRLLEDQELVELKIHFVQSVIFLVFSLHLLNKHRVVDLVLGIGRGEVISNDFNLIG